MGLRHCYASHFASRPVLCCAVLYLCAACRSGLQELYRRHISACIDSHESAGSGVRLGALLIEPVLQGAGGMLLVDPLFQSVMVQVREAAPTVRWLPLVV